VGHAICSLAKVTYRYSRKENIQIDLHLPSKSRPAVSVNRLVMQTDVHFPLSARVFFYMEPSAGIKDMRIH